MKSVLLVEPDRLQARLIQSILSDHYEVRWVRTTQGAVAALDRYSFDLVISETTLDHHNGVELLHEMRAYEDWSEIPLLFISALPSGRFPIKESDWKRFDVAGFLPKSKLTAASLLNEVQGALS